MGSNGIKLWNGDDASAWVRRARRRSDLSRRRPCFNLVVVEVLVVGGQIEVIEHESCRGLAAG